DTANSSDLTLLYLLLSCSDWLLLPPTDLPQSGISVRTIRERSFMFSFLDMLSVTNYIARRRARRLVWCLVILCSVWVFFKLRDGAAAVPVLRRTLGIVSQKKMIMVTGKGRRRASALPELPPVGADNRFDGSKRAAPSCPDPLHNR
ncbi:hypothetical protein B296_00058928, partial [Ensete ventricosum]